MSTNVFQVRALNAELLFSPDWSYGHPRPANQRGCEVTLVPDNLNRMLVNFTLPMGMWETHETDLVPGHNSEAVRLNGCWWIPNGNAYSDAMRPAGAFFMRSVIFSDEVTHFGYVSTVVGGLLSPDYSFDPVSPAVADIEPSYGHGVISWPVSNSQAFAQFRNPNSLPSDGASRINTTGTNWNRSNRLHPIYYTAHMLTGGTIASGNVSFLVEQRPSYYMTAGGNQFQARGLTYDVTTLYPAISAANYYLTVSRFWGDKGVVTFNAQEVSTEDAALNAAYPPLRINDTRTRNAASFQLSPEYYGIVQGSWLAIFSNKTSFIPVYLTNVADAWPVSANPRIAGVAFTPGSLDMWVLAEGGELTHLDMSVEGGLLVPKTSGASILADATERFGAVVKVGTTLYALVGSHCENLNLYVTTQTVGIVAYDTVSGVWGSRHDFALPARHSTRSLRELIALENGSLAALVENISSSVIVPTDLKVYGSGLLTGDAGIPADYQTVVVKLSGDDFVNPRVTRFRLRYQLREAHAIAGSIHRVPKGSPVGTAWTETEQLTCAGQVAWDNDGDAVRPTDWVNMVLDQAYDYYVVFYAGIPNANGQRYDGTNGPRYLLGYATPADSMAHSQATIMLGDQRSMTTVPDLTTGWLGGEVHALISGIFNDSGTDTFEGSNNTGLSTNRVAWQLLVHNFTGNTWNVVALTNSGLLSSPQNPQSTELLNPAAGKLLIQASPGADRLFLFDYTGTLDDTKFTDVSYGAAASLFDSEAPWDGGGSRLTIIKNTVDASVLFQMSASTDNLSTYAHTLGWAWPSFVWDGSERIQSIGGNPYSGGVTQQISKDKLYPAAAGPSGNSDKVLILSFSDTQATFVHPGVSGSSVYPISSDGGVYYLPRYFKFVAGNWVIAKNWADAALSPCTVPTTPDTAINGPHGYQFLFGPNVNTTFLAGEFHTFSAAWGKVKYARRARYTFTAFAGRTFQNVETRTLAQLRAIQPVIHYPAAHQIATIATGPASIAVSGGHCTWPIWNAGANDAPLVAEYNFTLAKPGPSLIPAMTADTTAGFSVSSSGGGTAWYACSRLCCNTHETGTDYYWNSTSIAAPWLLVDSSGPVEVLSYSFQVCAGASIPGAWTFQGADTPSGPWTDLHTVVGQSLGTAAPGIAGAGPHLPYFGNCTVGGNFRYHRLIFPGLNSSVRVANLEMYSTVLATAINFSDLVMFNNGGGPAYGLKFEVDLGSGFNAISPRYRSHNGEVFVFDRQEGVQRLRITSKNGRYLNVSTRSLAAPVLWDYGTTAVVNAARLGLAVAPDNTTARGSFDSQCLGVNTDGVAVTVDNINAQQFAHIWSSDFWRSYRGWWLDGPYHASATNSYVVHPYFGFVWFAPNVVGTTVTIAYAWGRRV